jgi:hypothetical protein
MSATADDLRPPVGAAAYDRGAERLLGAIAFACDPHASFAAQVESGLRATLAFFAAEPDFARPLALSSFADDEDAIRRRQHWLGRFGALLGGTAAAKLENRGRPRFLEPALIGGVSLLISGEVIAGRSEQLNDLLPTLVEFVLVYYLDPEEACRCARAAQQGS